jgi:hypothetical protein
MKSNGPIGDGDISLISELSSSLINGENCCPIAFDAIDDGDRIDGEIGDGLAVIIKLLLCIKSPVVESCCCCCCCDDVGCCVCGCGWIDEDDDEEDDDDDDDEDEDEFVFACGPGRFCR